MIPNAAAELPVLREFIDFINSQVGVYSDCLAGFAGNKARVERQVARVSRPVSQRLENGQPVMVWASVEDPSSPDIIYHRIVRAEDFLVANSDGGFNEKQICWSIIVIVFARWDEEVRPQIAAIRGVQPNDLQIDALGDLRILRKSIIHNGGLLAAPEHSKLKVLGATFEASAQISPSHDQMHKLFASMKQAVGQLILHHTGGATSAPDLRSIVDVAIQTSARGDKTI